uniref:Ig-like domain-containing protein n=1 Tax=Oryzias sinensis TaxID=183150 RepID=A0A8C7YIL1_9TELE
MPPLMVSVDVTVRFGGAVDLECEVEERPESPVLWVLPSQARLAAGSEDAGLSVISVHLHVLAEPPVIQQVQYENQTLAEGSSTFIHCTATGVPQPVIHWITPDGEVVYGGDLTVDCVASGLPPPQISWALPDGTMVNPGLSKDATRSGQSRRYEPFRKASRKSEMFVLLNPQRNNPGYHFQVWGV